MLKTRILALNCKKSAFICENPRQKKLLIGLSDKLLY
jgi:hypothetical protein